MKIRIDENGSKNTSALVVLIVILAGILLYTSGVISFVIPTAQDKYSEIVNRDPLDIGMKIPLDITVSTIQTSDGTNQADITVNAKQRHDTSDGYGTTGDYVPDPTLITKANFDTQVGNVGDTSTIFAVNGNSFQCSDIAYNGSAISLDSVDFGYAQNNYKVWTTDTTIVPDTTSLSNHVIVIQVIFDRLVKGTDTILNSYVVTFGIYFSLPAYDDDDYSHEDNYDFWVYCPFDDYQQTQDIRMTVKSYYDSCAVSWTETITATARHLVSFSIFGITVFEIVQQYDTVLTANLKYTWTGPRAYETDNSQTWGSHTYLYKIR